MLYKLCCMFSAIYWPASVSNWCDSCSCTEKENMISLDPGMSLGWGGHYRPLPHKVFTTSVFECYSYYLQMSSWLYGRLHQQCCLIHSCTGGLASVIRESCIVQSCPCRSDHALLVDSVGASLSAANAILLATSTK